MQPSFLQIIILSASLIHAQVGVQRNNSTSPTTSSRAPLFQVIIQSSSAESAQPTSSLVSDPSGTPLFHVVSRYATSTAYPASSSALVTKISAAASSEMSFAGHFKVPLAATVGLGMVVGLTAVV